MWYVPLFLLYKLLLYFVFSAACDLVWFYVSAAGDLMSSHKLRVYSFHQISKFFQLLCLQIIFIHPFLSILRDRIQITIILDHLIFSHIFWCFLYFPSSLHDSFCLVSMATSSSPLMHVRVCARAV